MEQAAPTQTTLGIALFENRVSAIFPLGPAALAGTLHTGDTGVFVSVAAPNVHIKYSYDDVSGGADSLDSLYPL
jgi:hypothetical protein